LEIKISNEDVHGGLAERWILEQAFLFSPRGVFVAGIFGDLYSIFLTLPVFKNWLCLSFTDKQRRSLYFNDRHSIYFLSNSINLYLAITPIILPAFLYSA
jgi:hypothetical protein